MGHFWMKSPITVRYSMKKRAVQVWLSSNIMMPTGSDVLCVFLPSVKKASANINLSSASGAASVVWMTRDTAPIIPKNRYMVECCQFIRSSQCFSTELYKWKAGPLAAYCSARIPARTQQIKKYTLTHLTSNQVGELPRNKYRTFLVWPALALLTVLGTGCK